MNAKTAEAHSGDLAGIAGLKNVLKQTLEVRNVPYIALTQIDDARDNITQARAYRITRSSSDVKTRVVLIGDSFVEAIIRPFHHSFDEIIRVNHLGGEFDFPALLDLEPDVIVFMPVEREAEYMGCFPKT